MASDLISRTDAEAALFGTDVLFAPIRHHSPACAWAVREMIRDHRPDVVLIEGPEDLSHHIAHFSEADLQLPIAIAALGPEHAETGVRPVSYYPLTEHSPEWVGAMEALALGAEVRFIDMPAGARLDSSTPPRNLHFEKPFDSAAFVAAMCAKLRLRDGSELWDNLFEHRLGQPDWRGFFADVYAYCMALRESTETALMEADRTLEREAVMRGHLAEVTGRTVVITGGFHTPALVTPGDAARPQAADCESYLIGYGEEALDTLSGYGAGLRHPGWYASAFRAALQSGGPPDWQALALETTAGFAGAMAGDDRRVPLPQLVEMATLAEGIARMKGRTAILLHDLFDGMRTALIKEQAGPGEPFTERMHAYLRGTALGRAPRAAGNPPIVEDARTRAKTARINLESSEKSPKKLDIRRKKSHRQTSHFLHQMALLDAGLADLQSGPDFLLGHRIDLLFEEWAVGWSPFVDGRLIEAAKHGATVPRAASGVLLERVDRLLKDGSAAVLKPWLDLMLTGLRAGLGANLPNLSQRFSEAVRNSSDFGGLGLVLARLAQAARPGDPLFDPRAPDLAGLSALAFDRLLYLVPDLKTAPDEALPDRIAVLRLVAGTLRGEGEDRFDRQRFDRALEVLLEDRLTPPLLSGAVMGILVQAGLRPSRDLAGLIMGTLLSVGCEAEERVSALRGLLMTAPALLWQDADVLKAADAAIAGLGDEGFLDVLPDLRRELAQLNPHETDRLAEEIADHLGLTNRDLTAVTRFTEADMARGLTLDTKLRQILMADGVLI